MKARTIFTAAAICAALSVSPIYGQSTDSFTPPRKNSDNSSPVAVTFRIGESMMLADIAGFKTSTMANTETEAGPSEKITGIGNWEWGTDLDTIADEIFTDYEKEYDDIFEKASEERDDVLFLQTWSKLLSVGGYDASGEFAFDDGHLCGGVYWLENITEEDLPDLLQKYKTVYGEPLLQKESVGWGQLTLWVDDDGDIVFVSGDDSIYYLQAGSPYTNECEEILSKYHEIDLSKELRKIGNLNGI